MQIIGLILNLIGTILFGFGALYRSLSTWEDILKKGNKAIWIYRLAWFGLVLIVIGFCVQISAII